MTRPLDAARRIARRALQDADFVLQTRALPRRVAAVQIRARARARRIGDTFSLTSATRPRDLALLLALARGRRNVVELGTGTAWTTIALAVADPSCEITSFDVAVHPHRDRYLALLTPGARNRIHLVQAPGATGPRSPAPIDLLYLDSSHELDDTIAEFRAWAPTLAPGAIVVFDDYDHILYPGVKQAVHQLGLNGEQRGTLFVHRVPVS